MSTRRKRHADRRIDAPLVGSYRGVSYGIGADNNTNPPVSGPAPGPMDIPQSGHLNPDQFVGFPGGFSTDAGNYTGVQAIEGAAGNGGAGGSGDSSAGSGTGGDSGGAAS